MLIDQQDPHYTVIVTIAGHTEVIDTVVEHAASVLDFFKKFPGFIAGATHRSESGDKIVQYVQWEKEQDYRTCMNHVSWPKNAPRQYLLALVSQGRLQYDVQGYKILKSEQ